MRILTIGDEEYILEYDINAGCLMEQKSGKSIAKLIDSTLTTARLMLWGGLLKHTPDITLIEAGDLLTKHGNWTEVMNQCFEEMKAAGFFGKAEGTPRKKRPARSGKSTQS